MVNPNDEAVDPALVCWLVELGRKDRETYRKLRELAWDLVLANRADPESSVNPNERS